MTPSDDGDTLGHHAKSRCIALVRLTAQAALVVLVAGCAPSTGPGQSSASSDPVAVAGDEAAAPTPETDCNAEAAVSFIGQIATPDVVEAARLAAHAAEARVIPKDGGATRDFKPNRLNVMLDEAGRIAEFRCG